MKKNHQTDKARYAPKFTVADRFVVRDQRLRADEAATATTFALGYAAKWAQAGGAR